MVIDQYRDQLGELVETRAPARTFSASELENEIQALLSGDAEEEQGVWVYYPWLSALVHLLEPEAFTELRTSRNQYKITRDEQVLLSGKRIGVVGLSVGHSAALALALERTAGELRIADFDRIRLSNLNRVRTGVQNLGLSKTVVTAREIAELDPFLEVKCFDAGLTPENMETFFLEGGSLDLVVDECDDVEMKFMLRRFARRLGIPVVMQTSEGGMLDIERFDLEPRRPLLHGVASELELPRGPALTTQEKVPLVLKILGGERNLSARTASSMLEIGNSVKTWPQLGSAVTMGGGVVADTCRRILLGEIAVSGRFHLDPEKIIGGRPAPIAVADSLPARTEAMERWRADRALEEGLDPAIPKIVALAALAPSGGNAQPWKFIFRRASQILELRMDLPRTGALLDFDRMASWMALGCVAEHAVLAAHLHERKVSLEVIPDEAAPDLGARLRILKPGDPQCLDLESGAWRALASQIPRRHTNRRVGDGRGLPDGTLARLAEATESITGARLQFLTSPGDLEELSRIVGAGDRIRFLNKRLFEEMMAEIRWTPEEAAASRDGIDLRTLELGPVDRAGVQLCRSWKTMQLLSRVGGGGGLEKPSRVAVRASAAVGLLTMPTVGARSYLMGGRALSRLWLKATELDLAFQPITSLPYLFARLQRGAGEEFGKLQSEELRKLLLRYRAIFEVEDRMAEILLFRLALAPQASARALRRPLGDFFEIHS